MRFCRVCSFLSCLIALPVWAQGEQPVGDRIRVLEERIQALEVQVRALQTSQNASSGPTSAPVARPAEVVVSIPSTAVGPGPSQETPASLPVYGGAASMTKVLNPDISVIGNFIGAVGSNPLNPLPALSLRESEFGFRAIIDPYARADFFLGVGEDNVEMEEGYITFPALPGGFSLRAGQMRASFGKTNPMHNHVLPWLDRPLVTFNLLGGEPDESDASISDAGFSVSRILPAPGGLFLEATAEVYRGESGSLFHSSRRSDVSAVGHLRAYHDLNESTNLEMGGSFARGHNDLGSDFVTQLFGMDAMLRWRPLRRAIYRSFVARTELFWSRREELAGAQRAHGFYASADYQFSRRWFAGARFDWSQRARDASRHDSGQSAVLTYWPSEFSQIRGQLRRTNHAEGVTVNELLFQFQYTIGAHGAHPF